MTEYDNTNRGVLFKNQRKESDKHPDYTGNINVDGTEFWLSAWIKDGAKGKFMSLSIKPKEDRATALVSYADGHAEVRTVSQRSAPKRDPISSGRNADLDDEVPF